MSAHASGHVVTGTRSAPESANVARSPRSATSPGAIQGSAPAPAGNNIAAMAVRRVRRPADRVATVASRARTTSSEPRLTIVNSAAFECRLCFGGRLELYYRQGNDGQFRFFKCTDCGLVNLDLSARMDQTQYVDEWIDPTDDDDRRN